MAESLLDQIHAQIRERIRALEPVAREYERVDAALTALGGSVDADARSARPTPVAKPAAAVKRHPKTPPSGNQAATKRAPRGANRAAVFSVLADRPGASASELATASGVGRTVLYGLLKRLEESGEIAKEQLPGGTTGYRLTREAPSAAGSTPGGVVSS
jgi:hypothetical protein